VSDSLINENCGSLCFNFADILIGTLKSEVTSQETNLPADESSHELVMSSSPMDAAQARAALLEKGKQQVRSRIHLQYLMFS